jgi:RPA family protein
MSSSIPTIERIARVLAGERLSSNAEGAEVSAGAQVDARWHEYREEAVAVLKSLRETPPEVVQTGEGEAWTRAINAALEGHQERAQETSALEEVAQSARHFLRAPS